MLSAWRHKFRKPMQFLEFNFIFYVIGFGLPSLGESGFKFRSDNSGLTVALIWTFVGMCSQLAGYHFASKIIRNFLPVIHINREGGRGYITRCAWVFIIFQVAYLMAIRGSAVDSYTLAAAVDICGAFGFVFIVKEYLTTKSNVMGFYSLIVFYVIASLSSGALAPFMKIISTLFMIYTFVRKKIPFVFSVMAIIVFIVLSPVKGEFRKDTWSTGVDSSSYEKFNHFFELAYDHWSGSSGYNFSDAADIINKRSDLAGLLGYVMEVTPSRIPYFEGDTIMPLLYNWIPRVLWSDKPMAVLGNEWSKLYGIIDETDFTTSWNLPWIVELYINFGRVGIVFGMFLIGGFIFGVDRLFSNLSASGLIYCVGVAVIANLWYAESNIALTFGNLFTKIIFLFFALSIFRVARFGIGKS